VTARLRQERIQWCMTAAPCRGGRSRLGRGGRASERGRPAGEVQPAVVGGGQWQRSLGAVRCVMTAAGGCSPCDPVVACAEYEGVLHVIRS
jgi:hypothetical protein